MVSARPRAAERCGCSIRQRLWRLLLQRTKEHGQVRSLRDEPAFRSRSLSKKRSCTCARHERPDASLRNTRNRRVMRSPGLGSTHRIRSMSQCHRCASDRLVVFAQCFNAVDAPRSERIEAGDIRCRDFEEPRRLTLPPAVHGAPLDREQLVTDFVWRLAGSSAACSERPAPTPPQLSHNDAPAFGRTHAAKSKRYPTASMVPSQTLLRRASSAT